MAAEWTEHRLPQDWDNAFLAVQNLALATVGKAAFSSPIPLLYPAAGTADKQPCQDPRRCQPTSERRWQAGSGAVTPSYRHHPEPMELEVAQCRPVFLIRGLCLTFWSPVTAGGRCHVLFACSTVSGFMTVFSFLLLNNQMQLKLWDGTTQAN